MQQLHRQNRGGQVLVLVALSLLVLLGIVALAVDGGNLYAERRKMQNAADAGALAGARVLCYEESSTFDDVEEEARIYAIDYNGAEGAQVTVSGSLTVTVVATETATTFFARVIGFPTADIAARASAMCQGPEGAGGLWPLAINEIVYTNDITVPCGSLFYAFVSINISDIEDIDDCNFGATEFTFYEEPDDCAVSGIPVNFPAADEIGHIGPGDMGWLRFFEPSEPYSDPCGGNCGANDLNCWLEYSHPGPISVGDCIPGEPGGNASTQNTIEEQACEIRNLILFDRECTADDPDPLGTCPGTPYRVSGFGCVRVVDYAKVTIPLFSKPNQTCVNPNTAVVIVQKMCSEDSDGDPMPGYNEFCMTVTGEPTGETPDPDGIVIIRLTE